MKKNVVRVVVGLIAASTPVLLSATPSSAGPPPPEPVAVTLTCAEGTYSFIQVLQLLDRKDNVVGVENLECGTGWDTYYPQPLGYPSIVSATVSGRVLGFSYLEWRCANTGDPLGAVSTELTTVRLAKKGPTTLRCPVPESTLGSEVTLTIG